MGYDEREAFRTAIQFEMLNSYLLLCSYYQYGGRDTSTIQNLTSQFEKLNSVLEQKAVQRRTDGDVYMYAAKKTLYISRESISYWNNGTKFTWTDSVISEFNSRMRGKTVEQELEMIGYEKSNARDKLVLEIDWDKTYCFFFYDY